MHKILAFLLVAAATLSAQTEDRVRQSILLQHANRLRLEAEFGAIRIQPGASQSVDVEVDFEGNAPSGAAFERMVQDFSLNVSRQGSELRVTGKFKNGWRTRSFFDIFGSCNNMHNGKCLEYSWLKRIEYRVSVPATLAVDLNTSGGSIQVGDLRSAVNATTSGGSLDLGRIDGPVNGRTSGGSIRLNGGGDRVILSTSGGSIRIAETEGEVEANTSGGSIVIDRTRGAVRAHTSGGSVTVREASGAVDASTSGGSIDVTLTGNKGYDLDARASGGRVSSDFPDPGKSPQRPEILRGPVNGGGPLVKLQASGGSVRIRRAQ